MECSGESFTDSLPKVNEHITNVGQSVLSIMGNPCFFYSLGAATSGISDVILIGNLPFKHGTVLINDTCKLLRANGNRLGRYDLLIADMPVYIMPCNVSLDEMKSKYVIRNEMVFDTTHHERALGIDTPEYVQFVFPDDKGFFPWDTEYNKGFLQPLYTNKTASDYPVDPDTNITSS
jgi:hypothetical protein